MHIRPRTLYLTPLYLCSVSEGQLEKQSIQTRCFILQSKGTSLTRSALGPRGREGNLITVPTSSVLLHDEEACFFDVGGRERRMRMLSFLPFSAEGRRFPVIRRQCKHSLSPPPPDGSRIQFLMMIVARARGFRLHSVCRPQWPHCAPPFFADFESPRKGHRRRRQS